MPQVYDYDERYKEFINKELEDIERYNKPLVNLNPLKAGAAIPAALWAAYQVKQGIPTADAYWRSSIENTDDDNYFDKGYYIYPYGDIRGLMNSMPDGVDQRY